jgi:hypothetical protein
LQSGYHLLDRINHDLRLLHVDVMSRVGDDHLADVREESRLVCLTHPCRRGQGVVKVRVN